MHGLHSPSAIAQNPCSLVAAIIAWLISTGGTGHYYLIFSYILLLCIDSTKQTTLPGSFQNCSTLHSPERYGDGDDDPRPWRSLLLPHCQFPVPCRRRGVPHGRAGAHSGAGRRVTLSPWPQSQHPNQPNPQGQTRPSSRPPHCPHLQAAYRGGEDSQSAPTGQG